MSLVEITAHAHIVERIVCINLQKQKKGLFMGTNYFLTDKPCKKCGHKKNEVHIGKSSAGWQFHFMGYRDDDFLLILSWKDWKSVIKERKYIIINEYDEVVKKNEFIKMVESKQKDPKNVNFYRIVTRTPETEAERAYIERNYGSSRNPYGFITTDCREEWNDEEGYTFGKTYFR